MARPGLIDFFCQAGKFLFRVDRIPVDEKTLVRKGDIVEVQPAELLAENGGLATDETGKAYVDVDGATIVRNGNKVAFSASANAPTATKWKNARKLSLTGAVTGSVTGVDGSKDVTLEATALDMAKANAGILAKERGGTGRSDGKTPAWATARAVDGVNLDGSAAINHFGACSTAAATAAKTVALAGYVLATGSRICVKFTVTNTAANPTLNVNNTGAKAIQYRGAAISAGYLAANRTYEFVYDGTAWQLVGDLDTNSTYSPATAAPKAAGTAAVGTSAKYAREDHVHPAQNSVSGPSTSCTGNSATSSKWATARAVDGVNLDGSAAITHYGTCSTAAATVAKVVACAGFVLVTGARILVRFTVSNTANNPTLNVNNTGAKAIRYRNSAIERYFLEANRTYEFIYDGSVYQLVGDLNDPYELCEFYYFRHPTLRRGFEPLTGTVIANAATKYPRAWAYLQTSAGKLLCKTEAEWQALSTKTYYTLADGTKLGFNGIGGVPFYVVDTAKKTLRMPDIRGTFPEPAGFDSLNVGEIRLDSIREIYGFLDIYNVRGDEAISQGVLTYIGQEPTNCGIGEEDPLSHYPDAIEFKASRGVPVSNAIRPRSFGVLACAYMGTPAL